MQRVVNGSGTDLFSTAHRRFLPVLNMLTNVSVRFQFRVVYSSGKQLFRDVAAQVLLLLASQISNSSLLISVGCSGFL
jgi:hypothetical protein